MIRLLWSLTRGYRLTPWRSPYLRWRLETYTGADARALDFRQFTTACWRSRRHFVRYLRWAADMNHRNGT